MNTIFSSWGELILPLIIIIASALFGYIIRWVVVWLLRRLARRFGWINSERFIPIIRKYAYYLCVLFGIDLALRSATIAPKLIPYIEPFLWGIFILVSSQMLSRVMVQIIQVRGETIKHAPATTLICKITQFGIYFVGMILILNSFGVNIAAIIAAMGIGGLALALALQDTLSNIFAGIYITIAGQIQMGNYIKISDAKFVEPAEGFIEDISWRTSVIRRLDGNVIILPNNVLSQATVLNYSLPEALCRVSMKISVESSENSSIIAPILHQIVTAQIGESSVVEVHLYELHEAIMDYMVFFSVGSPSEQFTIRDSIIQQISERFSAEKIMLKGISNMNITLLQQLAFMQKTESPLSGSD